MERSVIVESNRTIAEAKQDSQSPQNEDFFAPPSLTTSDPTNEWTTILRDPIHLQPGDSVTLFGATTNQVGASDTNSQTFLGETTPPLTDGRVRVDNRCKLKFKAYICGNNQIACPMPMGAGCIVDTNGCDWSQSNWGAPDLTGKSFIWPRMTNLTYPNLGPVTKPTFTGLHFFSDSIESAYNKYLSCRSGAFENGLFATTQSALNSDVDEKKNLVSALGYASFLASTPYVNLPGVQFGENIPGVSETLNRNIERRDVAYFEEDFDGIAAQISTGSGDSQTDPIAAVPQQNGGAAPYKLIANGLFNNSILPEANSRTLEDVQGGIYAFPCRKQDHGTTAGDDSKNDPITTVLLVRDPADFQKATGKYQAPLTLEPALYKGSAANIKPSAKRYYLPIVRDPTKVNRGPYYDIDSNTCVNAAHNLPQVSCQIRDQKFFHELETEVEIDVGTGNVAPARVGELISDALKKLQGTSEQPSITKDIHGVDVGVYPQVSFFYQPDTSIASRIVKPTRYPTIKMNSQRLAIQASKVCFPYPTLQGLILEKKVAGEWNAVDLEQCGSIDADPVEVDIAKLIGQGNGYTRKEGYETFYSLLASANVGEWSAVCKLLPPVQCAPMAISQLGVVDVTTNWWEFYSLVTGILDTAKYTIQDAPRRSNSSNLENPPGAFMASGSYNVGEYGAFPCLFTGGHGTLGVKNLSPLPITASPNMVAGATLGFQGTCVYAWSGVMERDTLPANRPADVPVNSYNINASRCSDRLYYKTNFGRYNVINSSSIQYSVVPTNVIWNGAGMNPSTWNSSMAAMEERSEETDASKNDAFAYQESTFFNNTYVNWTMGRLDDERSWPEGETGNLFGTAASSTDYFATTAVFGQNQVENPPIENRKGQAQYLPNTYWSNILLNRIRLDESGAVAWKADETINTSGTYTANDIRPILCSYHNDPNETHPVYYLRNQSNGAQDASISTYSLTKNPQEVFKAGIGTAIYDLSGGGNQQSFYGLPCYGNVGVEWVQPANDPHAKVGYERVSNRKLRCFRFLPQNSGLPGDTTPLYTAERAFNGEIDLGVIDTKNGGIWTTRPSFTSDFERFKRIWDKGALLNSGRGMGIIPIFLDAAALLASYTGFISEDRAQLLAQIPFVGAIATTTPHLDTTPLPLQGEYFFLGSPSLGQNDLVMPCSTQQSHQQLSPSPTNVGKPVSKGQVDPTREYVPQSCLRQSFKTGRQIELANQVTVNPYMSINDDETAIFRSPVNGPLPTRRDVTTNMGSSSLFSLCNTVQVGASDPVCTFDSSFNRYSISQLHTETSQGNGPFQLASQGANVGPEEVLMKTNGVTSFFSQRRTLPRMYFQKANDSRLLAGDAIVPTTGQTAKWVQSMANISGGSTNLVNYTDFALPDVIQPNNRGISGEGFRMMASDVCDGNVCLCTYNIDAVDTQGMSEASTTGFSIQTFSNFVPGGCSCHVIGQVNDVIVKRTNPVYPNNEAYSGQVFQINAIPNTAPFGATPLKVRCLGMRSMLPLETQGADKFLDWGQPFMYQGSIVPYAYIQADAFPSIATSAQSGVGIGGYSVGVADNSFIDVLGQSASLYKTSLFDKMGYDLSQIVPLFGKPSTFYDRTRIADLLSYTSSSFKQSQTFVRPPTTNADITTSNFPALVTEFGTASSSIQSPMTEGMPSYVMGQIARASGTSTATSTSILANRLPSKGNVPYLMLHSSLVTSLPCHIYGGADGSQQVTTAFSPLLMNYNEGDQSFSFASGLLFNITSPVTVTGITSTLLFPNGKSAAPILGGNSAVLYQINFSPRVPKQVKQHEKHSKEHKTG